MCFTVELSSKKLGNGTDEKRKFDCTKFKRRSRLLAFTKLQRTAFVLNSCVGRAWHSLSTQCFRWRCASGKHPYPSRTRWLRLKRPMILCWRRHGKAGGCREPLKKSRGKGDEIERHLERCNPHQRGSAVRISWFYQ